MKSLPGTAIFCAIGSMLVVFLIVTASVAQAQQNPDWRCESCPQATGWDLEIEGGPAYVSDDAYRFGDYTGLDEKGGYLFGEILGQYRGADGGFVNLEGFTLSSDSTALFVEGGKQGRYSLRGSYQAIPRRFFDETVTPYLGNGSNSLALPSDWVRGANTGQMTALSNTVHTVKVRRDWDVIKLGFDFEADSRWKFRTDYTRRERKGKNLSSGSFLFNAAEFTQPVDYTTDDIEMAVYYAADTWQTSVTYYGSYFKNDNRSLTWDNAYTGLPGADSGEIALAPNNKSHQFTLAGSLLLPARTTLNGQLSFGRLSQDKGLLPYTTNSLLTTQPLPTMSADAKADTLNVNVRATSSPWRKVTLEAELRYNEFNNKTPVNVYDYVVTDSALSGNSVANVSYDYDRREIKLRGEYRTSSSVKFYLGFDTKRLKRNFQERSHTDTDRVWFRLRSRIGDGANVNLDLFTEHRDGSSYDVVTNPAAQQNPLLRKYNLSDRDRHGIKFRSTLFVGSQLDFSWELEYGKDDFDDSDIGVSESRYSRVGADLSWVFDNGASTYASVFGEDVNVKQRNSQSFGLADWSATTHDTFTNATVGMRYPEIFKSLDAELEYTWARSVGETRNGTNGLRSEFPDLKTKRQTFRMTLNYDYTDSWRFGINYLFERLDTSDWALESVLPDTVPNLLSLGAQPFNYDVSVVYFSVRYLRQSL